MSDDLEIMDPTELGQQGRNYYDELAYSMRQRIINFIRAAPEAPEKRWKPLETFIESAPDSTVREIYARMMSVAEAAEVLMWKNRLEAYIEGNPPPPKYETDRGTQKSLAVPRSGVGRVPGSRGALSGHAVFLRWQADSCRSTTIGTTTSDWTVTDFHCRNEIARKPSCTVSWRMARTPLRT